MLRTALFLLFTLELISFEKVVIWGFKLHTHTHSYIHEAFYRAFKHLGYDVYWLDKKDEFDPDEFKEALFLLEHRHAEEVPLFESASYIVHTPWRKSAHINDTSLGLHVAKGRCILLKCFWNEYLEPSDWVEVEPYIYRNRERRELVMPWATNLLPYEIDEEKKRIASIVPKKRVVYMGTLGRGGEGANYNELWPFFKEAEKKGFEVFRNCPWGRPTDSDVYKSLHQNALLAPAIQGKVQVEMGYIPCRIFKNISYGLLGVTNSKRVYELFGGRIVYSPDTKKLFHMAHKRVKTYSLKERYELMDFVRDHHTYLNRIDHLLTLLEDLQ